MTKIGLLLSWLLAAVGMGAPVVRFAIIGDRTGGHQPGVYEGIVAEVERLRPDFVLTVGDQIEGYTEDTAVLGGEWREYDSIVAPLSMPLHLAPGNHDITTDGQLAPYVAHNGRPYYSLDIQDLHFIVLDNSRWESSDKLPPEELDWLAADLGRTRKARFTFVFMHKPFWEQTTVRGRPDTLHSLFRKYGVDAVFAGHYHQYFSGTVDGISYTAVGSSGGEASAGPTGIQYHFTWVTVDDAGIHIAPVTAGAVRAWDDVTVDDMRSIGQNEQLGVRFIGPVLVASDMKVKGNATVIVANRSETDTLRDTLRWEIPEGWSVKPDRAALDIAPGAEARVAVDVSCGGRPFPAPSATARLPYARGKASPVSRALRVARSASCVRAADITIDGRLNEKQWQQPETRFIGWDGAPAQTDSGRFYFAWDDTCLYVGAACFDPAVNAVRAQAEKQDDAVYNDDCVGFFFQPDTGVDEIYQIYFNLKGVAFDQKIAVNFDGDMTADPKWNGGYTAAGSLDKGQWSLEARIPLAQLGAKAGPNKVWGLNFRRKQPGRKANADWQPISYDPNGLGLLQMR
jgi:hypothetical protein